MRRLALLSSCLFVVACDVVAATDAPDLGDSPDATRVEAADLRGGGSPDLSGTPDYCNATDPRAAGPEVFATPEAGEQPYVDALLPAKSSIRVEIYLMGTGAILDTLKAKAMAGLSVRIILDQSERGTNQKYADQLTAAGAEVIWSDPQFSYMHAKFFVVDGEEAVISTGNFSRDYSILLERNFVARLHDPADVADLVTLFEADWVRAKPTLDCTRLIVSPVNSRARLLALIASAKTSLAIESMQFADDDIRAAVAERKTAGVEIRALLAQPSWVSANTAAASFLHGLGIEVRTIPHLHTKVLIVDGTRAYFGSENLSYTSLSKNREIGLITGEVASVQPLVDTFEKDWLAGAAL